MSKNNILIAKIIAPFGIKGQVKLVIFSDEPHNIANYPLFDEAGNKVKITLNKKQSSNKTSQGNHVLVASVDNIKTRNDAEDARNKEFFVNKNDLEEPEDDEFYYIDLIGLNVVEQESKKSIGKIVNIIDNNAGALIEIKFNQKNIKENYSEIELFLFKKEIFLDVNLKEKFVTVDLPDMVEVKGEDEVEEKE